jgi:hypothetical protein
MITSALRRGTPPGGQTGRRTMLRTTRITLTAVAAAAALAATGGAVALAGTEGSAAAASLPDAAGTASRSAAQTANGHCRFVLKSLPGGATGQVLGTDGNDRFAGTAHGDAVVWRNRHLTNLGPGRALDVNRAGVAVGADTANLLGGHAVVWRGHRKAVRLAEPTGVTTSVAVGITNSGLIVGTGNGPKGAEGLVWSVRTPHRVRTIKSPDGSLFINGVSDAGLIVGTDLKAGAVLSTAVAGTLRAGLHPLRTLSPGDSDASAAAGRYIVGRQIATPVLWVNRVPHLLPRAGADPFAVNRFGEAGGIDFGTFGPVVWLHGVMIALSAGSSGIGQVNAVTDRGEAGGTLGNGGGPVTWTWTCRR